MRNINIEIKSRFDNHDKVRTILKENNADYLGIDFETDTYFNVRNGSLKLREGNIDSKLIHEPANIFNKKDVLLYETQKNSKLKEILEKSYGILKVIEKHREVYQIKNVKFYIDFISSEGSFVGIEAIGRDGSHTKEELLEQCHYYVDLLGLENWRFVQNSYSDMLDKLTDEKAKHAA